MVFSSWQFIFAYLPITFAVYFWLNNRKLIVAGKLWLVTASLFFYAYWDISYLPLIVISILMNFAIGKTLARIHHEPVKVTKSSYRTPDGTRKLILTLGILANLVLLAHYKYTDFLLTNINAIFTTNYPPAQIILPLAISFFTFTQIVYLVDSYRRETTNYDLLNYALFVTFFPHLIAGPIVHHRQIMSQFSSRWTLTRRNKNVLQGLFIFSIGLFKKAVIADSFAIWADTGFDSGRPLGFYSAWATSLSYTFQLYFDFSGYTDMAFGAALLFNIFLPINFDSPYKALDIQDFWRRWHITLSNFLRDYLYIPMGGNRRSEYRMYINLFVTFLIGGLWHGATWMFVIWGGMHGGALIVHRLWSRFQCPLPTVAAWFITFTFINISWIFFRAKTLDDASRVLNGMFDIGSAIGDRSDAFPVSDLAWAGWSSDLLLSVLPADFIGQIPAWLAILAAFAIIRQKNTLELVNGIIDTKKMLYGASLFSVAMYSTLISTNSVFLYFNF